jgi:predicted metal-binding membrane protein
MARPRDGLAALTGRSAHRLLVFAGLAVIAAVAWLFLLRSAATMDQMHGPSALEWLARAMMDPGRVQPYLLATVAMWTAMMLAMMIPAASPSVALFLKLDRGPGGANDIDALAFAAGYLLLWIGFGAGASLLQWALHRHGLLDSGGMDLGPVWAGATLFAAGLYQLSPLKESCLRHCQSPLGFLLGHWREGAGGALRMGLHHGTYCLGCCWALMLLMFAGGVMSVATMAVLSTFILLERLLPPGAWSRQLPGWLLMAWGALMIWSNRRGGL